MECALVYLFGILFLGVLWFFLERPNQTQKPNDRSERPRQRRRVVQPRWDENTFEPPWLYDDYLERPEEYEDWQ
jgi:hypothetical protein